MDRDIVLRALAGHAERFVLLTRAAGGQVIELDGAVLTYVPGTGPNSVFFTGPAPDHAAVLDHAAGTFGSYETSYAVCLRERLDDPAGPMVTDMHEFGRVDVMALSPIVAPEVDPPDVAGFEIREVRGPEGLETYLRVGAEGFEEHPDAQRPFYPPGVAADPTFRFFVGAVGSRLVATGGLITTPSGAGVYGISTVPALRRRGVGAAMTAHVLRVAAGSRPLGFLQPTPASGGLYARLGFQTVGAYRLVRSV